MQISSPSPKRNLISLTPLIDIVFILLVFFMLASSFIEWQFIELGVSESETLTVDQNHHSLVYVGLEQKYQLNGTSMQLDEIVMNVREKIRNDLNHPVLVQPEDTLPLQQLLTVLEPLKAIAGNNVSLATQVEQ